ncbi:hypothetical protein CC1G_01493 [Coprinopsis cinerea okayama7|uniref:Uncharacterized protein n=1 Tax=Coprinopsis cinerea (strain Okayama-7 / 130 / ATCC MYA-4618 / FGSC 9003) TaxID=240176 RepID=A8NHS5_COPC7|nr:hypothetical protein CC1G_01493 [Coprinopsis cinerea okayama7\|eukprot:XP_001833816.2 hypothetical protein CC1G_01493 [Coprinopsis cinerea okayama7\
MSYAVEVPIPPGVHTLRIKTLSPKLYLSAPSEDVGQIEVVEWKPEAEAFGGCEAAGYYEGGSHKAVGTRTATRPRYDDNTGDDAQTWRGQRRCWTGPITHNVDLQDQDSFASSSSSSRSAHNGHTIHPSSEAQGLASSSYQTPVLNHGCDLRRSNRVSKSDHMQGVRRVSASPPYLPHNEPSSTIPKCHNDDSDNTYEVLPSKFNLNSSFKSPLFKSDKHEPNTSSKRYKFGATDLHPFEVRLPDANTEFASVDIQEALRAEVGRRERI